MKNYDHKKIEKSIQKYWENKKIFSASKDSKKPKFYGLIEFPYPSGDGLHVGHIRSNTAMDIISRKRRMQGYNVLYPIGWDAFGLPTENYAIKTGKKPALVTKKNTDTFRRQLKEVGFSFDWSREINTTDPKYYKWTQWIFLQFFKKGLAYKAKKDINWCPKCKIGLANEEAIGGVCDRCGGNTEKKEKEQWMLAITKYADRLDRDLDLVDYPERVKTQQRNWIGKSEGSEIDFKIKNSELKIKIFTTRADTLFGVTYVVLAPEHDLISWFLEKIENKEEVEEYIKNTKIKSETDRISNEKEKTGVELKGIKAINPANNEEVPVWIADYVLVGYGTGAVMAVPAHDERDFKFAEKYNLSIKDVVIPREGEPHENSEYRRTVSAIVHRKKDDKYLIMKWNNDLGWISQPIGGIENNENIEEAVCREVLEETGYKVKMIKKLGGIIESHFFAKHKNIWRFRHDQPILCELIDEDAEPEKVEEVEKKLHSVVWLTYKEVLNQITHSYNKLCFLRYFSGNYSYTENGFLVNSGQFDGISSEEARKKITEFVNGKIVTKFKLRDWVFSRQRYWGEPIPIIECKKCGYIPVPEKELPVKLPDVKSYKPTDTGESPLANIKKWVNVKCPKCKGNAKRETDTMPNWAGSSWYYLRYIDPKNNKNFADKKKLKYWTPVDWYNGGMEHTTLHLLYSRFWHKFLYDLKLVPTAEPYKKRTSHGMILGAGGVKMSKSLGNVVNPDEIVKTYGADTLRIYEMFMGPFDESVAWSTESIIGSRRFIEKVWRIQAKLVKNNKGFEKLSVSEIYCNFQKLLHKTIKKVSEDIENMHFNTAISSMMMLATEMEKNDFIKKSDFKIFLQILCPFAPHLSEYLWFSLGEKKSISLSVWPKYSEDLIKDKEIKIAVQVNGKVRSEILINMEDSEDKIKERALVDENIKKYINNPVKRIIYIKNRIINILV